MSRLHITCPHCTSVVFSNEKPVVVEKPTLRSILGAAKNNSAKAEPYYSLKDPFAFDNISVSKPLASNIKLLACGECEKGPLGYFDPVEKEYLLMCSLEKP
ncbi:guanyl-nucleotide exchange factor [Schizosaccharomyces cryophilus OY26]|uniref:Guanyl-nucleotide exchange factor n=1 Tax=Schizosaccharomyces cryophilus (strain OY26 / ATCC MYA-4695 / CBS 11777 / NBRC 106824 / NRRL Y48691) TaxID=653667 RepID=S9XA42_SCHCR|nr:guanyl-nucleotide exchange factor [Schizosaccharomyces cryophilus OY26]EPY54007.1 guanyl-nucleotide exchange factor [Schizosaccharomyces cryophilus OY26]